MAVSCRPVGVMWTPPSRASGPGGVPQLRGSSGRWPWRPPQTRSKRRRVTSPDPMTASSGPASRRSTRSSDRAACRSRPASRSAARARAAARRSACGSSPRRRPRARSSRGSICHVASTRSRPWPVASTSTGSSSSRPSASTRVCRSRGACWPVDRSTCSSSTCQAVDWPGPTDRPGSATGCIAWPRSRDVPRRCC